MSADYFLKGLYPLGTGPNLKKTIKPEFLGSPFNLTS